MWEELQGGGGIAWGEACREEGVTIAGVGGGEEERGREGGARRPSVAIGRLCPPCGGITRGAARGVPRARR